MKIWTLQKNDPQPENINNQDKTTETGTEQQENKSSKKSTELSTSTTQDSHLVFDDDLTDEIKQCMIDKSPSEITTFEEALNYYYQHLIKRWQEAKKRTDAPVPLTDYEKIAFKYLSKPNDDSQEKDNSDMTESFPYTLHDTDNLLQILKFSEDEIDPIEIAKSILQEDTSEDSVDNLDELKIIAEQLLECQEDSFCIPSIFIVKSKHRN